MEATKIIDLIEKEISHTEAYLLHGNGNSDERTIGYVRGLREALRIIQEAYNE